MGLFSDFAHIVREQEPLAPFTWFRLGGCAEYFAEPTSVGELAELLKRCRQDEVPVKILGGGSNLLIRDEGVKGLVVHLSAADFGQVSVENQVISAGGGAKLGPVISTAVREGLAGLEQLVGTPGTVGGALRGNVDAGGSDIGQWVKSVTVMNREGAIVERERENLRFSYRHSNIDELVILTCQLELEPGDSQELTKRLQKIWIVRRSGQPQGNQNLGCIFKDNGGVSAASLIEQAGLKTAQVGRARVSEVDANFVIAEPGAKSAEVLELIDTLKSGVAERLGIELEMQIEVW